MAELSSKFKVGQKVRVVMEDHYMQPKGVVGTIEEVDIYHEGFIKVDFDGESNHFIPCDLEVVEYVGNVGGEIRGTHPYSFRSGEWAKIIGEGRIDRGSGSRDIWIVEFPDFVTDFWSKEDSGYGYEYK